MHGGVSQTSSHTYPRASLSVSRVAPGPYQGTARSQGSMFGEGGWIMPCLPLVLKGTQQSCAQGPGTVDTSLADVSVK